MKQISRWPVVQQIAPWIAGVITVFFGIFLVGLAVTHQTMLGAGIAVAVVLIGVFTVFRWFLKSDKANLRN
ncbi:MAG: hypothetical protein WA354_08305 [Terracidiphilus sp.]